MPKPHGLSPVELNFHSLSISVQVFSGWSSLVESPCLVASLSLGAVEASAESSASRQPVGKERKGSIMRDFSGAGLEVGSLLLLLTFHWSEHNLVATLHCQRGWLIYLVVYPSGEENRSVRPVPLSP